MCKLMSFKVLNYNFTCFLLIFGIQVICLPLFGQKRPVSKKEIKPAIITPNTPFNDLMDLQYHTIELLFLRHTAKLNQYRMAMPLKFI